MELGNAGHDDQAKLQARITVGEQVMRRFTDCDQLMIENWRRATAEAWFSLGDTGKADELYRGWLDADPAWGFGWIGWASCHMPPGKSTPKNYQRAEDLLRRGHAVSGLRDRDAVADWLRLVCEETGRPQEARDFARQAAAIGAPAPPSPARKAKAGRNEPCPCGSGKKYKRCRLVNQAGNVIAPHRSRETRLLAGWARPAMTGRQPARAGDQAARRVRTASGRGMLGT